MILFCVGMKNLLKYFAIGLMLLSGVMTSVAAVFQEMHQAPAHLMLKKSGKTGSELLAEWVETEEENHLIPLRPDSFLSWHFFLPAITLQPELLMTTLLPAATKSHFISKQSPQLLICVFRI